MPASQAPFDSLPKDGKTYRIYWAGQVVPRPYDSGTPRVAIWLRETSHAGTQSATQTGLVWESCGSVPSMPIGSFWRDQVRIEGPVPSDTTENDFVLRPTGQWSVVQAGGKRPPDQTGDPRPHRWINPSDFVLTISDQSRARVPGWKAWIVPAQTVDGREVIFPCYEVFRAFYGGTSELAVKLLTEPWNEAAIQKLVSAASVATSPSGQEWQLSLTSDMTETALRYLARLVLDSDTRREAAMIYPWLVHERQFELEDPWLKAALPVRNRSLKIRARVRALPSRNAVLVEEILSAEYPAEVAGIQVVIPRETIVLQSEASADTKNEPDKTKSQISYRIGIADDRREGVRVANLTALSPIWLEAPKIKKSAAQTRVVTKADEENTESESDASEASVVSVGADGHRAAAPRASLSAQVAQELHDRFAALHTTLRSIEKSRQISSWESIAIVDPWPPAAPRYCAFPQQPANRPRGWAGIGGPQPRARVAWVLALHAEGKTTYWIESEARATGDIRCSLCFRTLHKGPLAAQLLRRLLTLCAEMKGVWPARPPQALAREVNWVRVRHRFEGDAFSVSTIVSAFERLDAI